MIIDTERLRNELRKHMKKEYKINAPRVEPIVAERLLDGLEYELAKDLQTLKAAERLGRDLRAAQKNLRKFEREIKEGKR